MTNNLKNILKPILSALFPQRCAYCLEIVSSNRLMCEECEKTLPRISGTICPKCAREKDFCSCRGAEAYYTAIAAPFYYKANVRKGIHAFKFRNYLQNADAYASEMSKTVSERFPKVEFDFVTEVPMTAKSIKKRGYNQEALLAQRIGKNLSIPYRPNVLKKLYETEKQHNLSFYLRRGNLTGTFDVCEPLSVKDKTVLLVDDISTSGETLNECAKMLWLYEAKEIYCVTVALTVYDKTKENKAVK